MMGNLYVVTDKADLKQIQEADRKVAQHKFRPLVLPFNYRVSMYGKL
jgi:hypothetical protein